MDDGEGASQASVSRIVKQVSEVLSDHMDDLVVFNVDPDMLDTVARDFFGFSGSKCPLVFSRKLTKITL